MSENKTVSVDANMKERATCEHEMRGEAHPDQEPIQNNLTTTVSRHEWNRRGTQISGVVCYYVKHFF